MRERVTVMANVALGKTIEEACVNVKAVTDGNITRYDGQTGYCAFPWPANLTLDLKKQIALNVFDSCFGIEMHVHTSIAC